MYILHSCTRNLWNTFTMQPYIFLDRFGMPKRNDFLWKKDFWGKNDLVLSSEPADLRHVAARHIPRTIFVKNGEFIGEEMIWKHVLGKTVLGKTVCFGKPFLLESNFLGNRSFGNQFLGNRFGKLFFFWKLFLWKTVFLEIRFSGKPFLENTVFAIIFASTNLARKCNLKCNLKPSISFHLNLFSNGLRQAEARFTQIVFPTSLCTNIVFQKNVFQDDVRTCCAQVNSIGPRSSLHPCI